MKKIVKNFMAVFLVVFALYGCDSGSDKNGLTTSGELLTLKNTGKNYVIEYTEESNWGTGLLGYITIYNTGNTPISNWTLEFDWDKKISSIWLAETAGCIDDHYMIKPSEWNNVIPGGSSVYFGFVAEGGTNDTVPANYIFKGDGVINTNPPQIELFERELRGVLGEGYIIEIAPNIGDVLPVNSYTVLIYQDPALPWPTLLGLFASSRFVISLGSNDEVIVDSNSFTAVYQGFPGEIDGPMLLEGLRQLSGETGISPGTLGLLDDILIQKIEEGVIYFQYKDQVWKIVKDVNFKVRLIREIKVDLEQFAAGLRTNISRMYSIDIKSIPTFAPPSVWGVTITSMVDCSDPEVDCYMPGQLDSLYFTVFEEQQWNPAANKYEVVMGIYEETIEASYYQDTGFAAPAGEVLYKGLMLWMEQTGATDIYNYDPIIIMTKIKNVIVTKSGSIFFNDPEGYFWVIYVWDGKVVLERAEGING